MYMYQMPHIRHRQIGTGNGKRTGGAQRLLLSSAIAFALFHSGPATTHAIQQRQISPPSALSSHQQRKEWQTSWIKFVEGINEFCLAHKNSENKDLPQTTFQMLLSGQRVPKTWGVMKRFGGTVEFQGALKEITTGSEKEKLLAGKTIKLEIEMPVESLASLQEYGGTLLHVYPRASAIPAWKKTPIGKSLRFRGIVTGIAFFELPIRGGLLQQHVLLEDAIPHC